MLQKLFSNMKWKILRKLPAYIFGCLGLFRRCSTMQLVYRRAFNPTERELYIFNNSCELILSLISEFSKEPFVLRYHFLFNKMSNYGIVFSLLSPVIQYMNYLATSLCWQIRVLLSILRLDNFF